MHRYNIISDAQALAATVAETLLQLVTPATRRAKVTGFSIALESVTATDVPVLVELMLQTTAGTASAVTPTPFDQADPAALCTAQKSFTAEPTASTVIRRLKLTPIGGLIVYDFPEGEEITMAVSTRLGLRVTAPQAQTGTAELRHQE